MRGSLKPLLCIAIAGLLTGVATDAMACRLFEPNEEVLAGYAAVHVIVQSSRRVTRDGWNT